MADDENGNGRKPSRPGMLAYVPSLPPPPTASPATLDDVLREVRSTRRLLEVHLDDDRVERQRQARRQEAIMDMLKDILVRLP